jgi:hypothetical protein
VTESSDSHTDIPPRAAARNAPGAGKQTAQNPCRYRRDEVGPFHRSHAQGGGDNSQQSASATGARIISVLLQPTNNQQATDLQERW